MNAGQRKPRVPKRILALQPYTPGRPIEEVERELGIRDSIKLASNENPLGPSPAALEAMLEAVRKVHFYPEGGAVLLARKLAAMLGVAESQLVFGNGSNEIIELLVRLFAEPGSEVVFSADAFVIYELVTRAAGATPVAVPATDYHHDLDAIAAAITAKTRLVFLANPNNPTGTIFRRESWRRFVSSVADDVVVVVDEAYAEYVDDDGYPDVIADLAKHPGLVVLRTFSKIYGLAGLRIGYGVASLEIADALARLRQPFNVNSVAQAAALAALDDGQHVERSRALVREARQRYARGLEKLGLDFVPSQANFVLVEVGDGSRVARGLLERGVIVRPMAAYAMASKIRVTFGTAEQDQRCLDTLAAVMAEE